MALFLGASDQPDSGWMLNHGIHPGIALEPGQTLTRRLRLELQPWTEIGRPVLDTAPPNPGRPAPSAWPEPEAPSRWISRQGVQELDGVGHWFAGQLEAAGLGTIGALARCDGATIREAELAIPTRRLRQSRRLSPDKLAELRGKARLALRSRAERLPSVRGLDSIALGDLLLTPRTELVCRAESSEGQVERLVEAVEACSWPSTTGACASGPWLT